MSGLLGMIGQHLDPNTIGQISSQLGMDPATTQKAVAAALPSLLGGMAQHATTDQGAAQIQDAVSNAPADGAVPTTASAAGGLLSNILGAHQETAASNVAKASGIDTQQAGKVLLALAPLAVAVLARKHAQDPSVAQQPGGIASVLQNAAAEATSGGATSALGGILGRVFG